MVVSGELPSPRSIEVHPTNRCVNDCEACIGQNIRFDGKLDLSYNLMRDIVSYASSLKIALIISGNHCEPFVNRNVREVLKYILEEEPISTLLLFTTTYHLDDEIIGLIANTNISIYLAVGLYGHSEESYLKTQRGRASPKVFQRSLENTLKLVRASSGNSKVYIDIHYLATPASTDDFEGLKRHMKFLLGQGVSRFYISNPLRPIDHKGDPSLYGHLDEEHYGRLKGLLSAAFRGKGYNLTPFIEDRGSGAQNPFKRCYVQYFFPTVGADSGIYPCCYTTSHQGMKRGLQLGKLEHGTSFSDVWFSDANRDFNPSKVCPTCSKSDHAFNLIVEKAVNRFRT